MHRRPPLSVGMIAILAVVSALGAACVTPSGGTLISTGIRYSGEYSIISPATYYFDGTAGDHLTLEATSPDGFGGTVASIVTVRDPGGAPLSASRQLGFTVTVELPTTGRYRIELHWPGADTFPHTYSLRAALDEFRGPVTLGALEAPPVMAGQAVTWSYPGTAGEVLNTYRATVIDEGGTPVPDNGVDGRVTLPADATYTIQVVQSGAALTKDLEGGAVGIGQTVTPPLLANQGIRYTYLGTAGEALGTIAGTWYEISAPDGSILQGRTLAAQRLELPVDGTYLITIRPFLAIGPGPVTEELWLSHDYAAGPIGPGTTSLPGDRVPGQSVVYDYAGTAGEALWVHTVRLFSYPTCPFLDQPGSFPHATHVVEAPDGAPLNCTITDDGTQTWTIFDLPVDGTYRLVVTPKTFTVTFGVGLQSFLP